MRWLIALPLAALLLAPVALAAAGRSQLNVYFQATMKSGDYQRRAFDKVAKAWRQPPAKKAPPLGGKTVVQAVIAKSGKLVSATVSMKSGSKAWDDAALAAVKKAAPFDPLPSNYELPTVEAHFHLAWQKRK